MQWNLTLFGLYSMAREHCHITAEPQCTQLPSMFVYEITTELFCPKVVVIYIEVLYCNIILTSLYPPLYFSPPFVVCSLLSHILPQPAQSPQWQSLHHRLQPVSLCGHLLLQHRLPAHRFSHTPVPGHWPLDLEGSRMFWYVAS